MGRKKNGAKNVVQGDITEADLPNRGRCCCCRLPGWLMAGFMVIYLLGIAGLSGTAVVLGRKSNFSALSGVEAAPNTYIKAGWLQYTTSELKSVPLSLKDINFAIWLLGVLSGTLLCISVIVALTQTLILLRGRGGWTLSCCAFPLGILLAGTLIGYYTVGAIHTVKFGNKSLMWPAYAWLMGMGAALLWLLTSLCACGLPSQRHKEYLKHEEPHVDMYPYSEASSFARSMKNGSLPDAELGRPKLEVPAKKGWSLFKKKPKEPAIDLPDYARVQTRLRLAIAQMMRQTLHGCCPLDYDYR